MCTYNGAKFLAEQLLSIVQQTRQPEELVICDDGSTDDTLEIVREFSRSAPFPVRVICNPQNLGSTKNFEKAMGLCRGDLIALSDQDDIWMAEKLACQAEMMESDAELGGVFSDAQLVDDRSNPLNERLWRKIGFTPGEQTLFQKGQSTAILTGKNVVTGATLMVRASLLPRFLPIPAPWVHDGWIAWMLAVYSKLGLIPDALIHYRIHAGQQLGVKAIASSRRLTLMERLRESKREGPAMLLAQLREMQVLERHLAASGDLRSQAVLQVYGRK